MRRKIVAGNWKMNPMPVDAALLIESLVNGWGGNPSPDVQLVVCPPLLYTQSLRNSQLDVNTIGVGAQNCHFENNGAYTGEVSAAMLAAMGVQYCIVGHSERRAFFGETDEWVLRKIQALLKNAVSPIVCCGELLDERESGKQFDVVARQLKNGLKGITAKEMKQVIIAYEPVWAIGTGKTATAAQAQEMHAFIRNELSTTFGVQCANETSILYGGSCKPDNARELFACHDVDGGLIGGAALVAKDFLAIAHSF
jgi:triosephosphate isomerase (TIM)